MEQGLPVRPRPLKPKADLRPSARESDTGVPASSGRSGTRANMRRDRNSEWARHMPTIKRLYIDEDRPLKEVMAIMSRDYGFDRMAKTFKYHLKQAGHMKNVTLKDPEAVQAALRLLQPETEGGPGAGPPAPGPYVSASAVAVAGRDVKLANGQTVSVERLAEHLRRKRLLVHMAERERQRGKGKRKTNFDINDGTCGGGGGVAAPLAAPVPVPSPGTSHLDAPRSFRLVEQILAKSWAYRSRRTIHDTRSTTSTQHMPSSSSSSSNPHDVPASTSASMSESDFSTYQATFHTVMNTRDLLQGGNLRDAVQLLKMAPGHLRDALRVEPPRTLDMIFNFIVVLADAPGPGPGSGAATGWQTRAIVRSLVRYLAELSAEMRGLYPDLRDLFRLLYQVSLDDDDDGGGLAETTARAWKCVLTYESSICPPTIRDTVLMAQKWAHLGAVAGYHLLPPGWAAHLRAEHDRYAAAAAPHRGEASDEAVMLRCVLVQYHGQRAVLRGSGSGSGWESAAAAAADAADLEEARRGAERLLAVLGPEPESPLHIGMEDLDPSRTETEETHAHDRARDRLRRRRDLHWGLSTIHHLQAHHGPAETHLRAAIRAGVALGGEHADAVFRHRVQLRGMYAEWARARRSVGGDKQTAAYEAGVREMDARRREYLAHLREQVSASGGDDPRARAEARYVMAYHATWRSVTMFTPIGLEL